MPTALGHLVRQYRQRPGFFAVTVLVLGLGIGAATLVFSVVDAVVLRPLPYTQPDRLVTLWDTNTEKGLAHDPISPVNFMDYRVLPVFADAAAWWRPGINLEDPGQDPLRVNTIEVSNNLFTLLGVTPQVGDGFPASTTLHHPDRVAVISDRLWRSRYNADPSVIGRPLSLNATAYRVVGVMPPGFHYPDDVDVWQRLQWDLTQHSRAAHFMEAVARLAPGVTFDEAQAATSALGVRLQNEFRDTNLGWNARLVPLIDEQLGYYRPALMVLLGAVGLLVVIGVLNVASLLLTKALSREREVAIRTALGASSRQIVAQLMWESAALSAAGAVVGLAVAAAALPLLAAFLPVEIPRLAEAGVNGRALAVSVGVAVVATFVFGLVPSLLLARGRDAGADLKSGERGSSRGARRIYKLLVGAEVALACALLVASALLVRSVGQMTRTPTGVTADDVLTTTVQLTPRSVNVPDGATRAEAWRLLSEAHARLLEAIRRQPGVVAAGHSNFLPLTVGWRNPFRLDSQPPPARPEDLPQAQMHSASDGYFEAMGARVVAGRAFSPFDTIDAPAVVIVNETFARRYLSASAVGTVIRNGASGIGPLGFNLMAVQGQQREGFPVEVVGVVGDVKNTPLGQDVEPAIYFPTRQFPFSEVFLAVSATDLTTAQAAVRTALRAVAPAVPMGPARSWGDRMAATTAEARLLMSVLIGFGVLAAVLAALGVYGLFSWAVALRTRELAIRLTLGATPRDVGVSVLRQSAWLIGGGLLAGIAIVQVADVALTRVLYGVRPSDPLAITAAALLLLVAALGACLPAARRAMRVDPAVGLRVE